MRRFSSRITERRIRAQWLQKVEGLAFHTRFASRKMGPLGTLALCAAVPATVPTILATSPSTAISHRNSHSPRVSPPLLASIDGTSDAPRTTVIAVQGATAAQTPEAVAPAEQPSAPLSGPSIATDPSPATAPVAAPVESTMAQQAVAAIKAAMTPKTGVRVLADGRQRSAYLALPEKATVADVLHEMGLTLADTDRVWPDRALPAKDGMSIRVTRVHVEMRKHQLAIPFETLFQPSTDLRPASQKTIQDGQAGAREISERIWSKEGKVTVHEPVSDKVIREPRPQIVALGTRSAYLPNRIPYHNRYAQAYALAARGGLGRERLQMRIPATMKPLRAVRSISLVATGYSPDPRENGGWTRTATGLPIGYGAAAVDPRVVPLGTKMYIEGYGYAFACDTGGAIQGHRIDLAYDSYRLANTKGRKTVKVWILQ